MKKEKKKKNPMHENMYKLETMIFYLMCCTVVKICVFFAVFLIKSTFVLSHGTMAHIRIQKQMIKITTL